MCFNRRGNISRRVSAICFGCLQTFPVGIGNVSLNQQLPTAMRSNLYKKIPAPNLLLAALLQVWASHAGAADTDTLGSVVVTATRMETGASVAPAAVTVVTAKNIEEKNASRFGDVLDQTPSIYLRGGALGQSQGTIGTSGMSLRGIDQTRVLILIDGQPIQDASSGKVNWRIPFIEDIERVEVVPGAYSSLYGSNAIGGVINVITKQPDKREVTAKVRKGWSDASGEDASIYYRNKLENGLGIVAGVGRQRRDSYINDFVIKTPTCPAPPAPCTPGTAVSGAQAIKTREGASGYLVGDLGRVPWNSSNATAKLYYDVNSHDKIYGGVAYEETNADRAQFNTYLRNSLTGAPVSSSTLDIKGQRVALSNSDFTFVSSLPLHEAATRYFAGYDGMVGNDYRLKLDVGKIRRAYSFSLSSAAATWDSGAGTLSDTPNDGLDATAQLSFAAAPKHFVVMGLALHKDSVNQQIYALSNWRDPATKTSVASRFNGNSTTTSVFVQDEITVADSVTAYVGGRLDDWETHGDNFVAATTSATTYPKRSASAFSPKASVVYKPSPGAVLRASFGRSFRTPTNQDMYTAASVSRGRTTASDPNLQPERGTTWEVGGELRFTENTKVTATYYDTELSNLIYVVQLSSTNSQRTNAGKARVSGIELGLSTRLAKWLAMDANYAYVDSRILESKDEKTLSVGKRLTDSPRNIAGIGLTARQGAWTGVLNARYISHVFWNAQNTDVVEGVPGSYDGYTVVNAKASYAFSKTITGNIAINNLLDDKNYSYFLNPGRNVVAGLDFTF